MPFLRITALSLTLGLSGAINASEEPCYAGGWTKAQLLDLKSRQFAIADDSYRNQMALQLLNCLAVSDPQVRDGVAYEALFTWMRADKLDTAVLLNMHSRLLARLDSSEEDPLGFHRPFAALVLAEVLRVDRISPFLDEIQFQGSLESADRYLRTLRDYRGFNDKDGWRHGVAHTADLFLQMALNPRLNKTRGTFIWSALGSQIAPHGSHFYHFGEARRLARPALFVWLADLHALEDWQAFLDALLDPGELESWASAYSSEKGLARLHNTRSFLLEVHAMVNNSENDRLAQLRPSISSALKILP